MESRLEALQKRLGHRFAEPAPHRTLALAWRKSSPLGPALRRLAGTIREAYTKAEPRLEQSMRGA